MFLSKGRGRIVPLLRGRALTVNDLAAALGLTDHAVRMHLSLRARDGRGGRAPATRPGHPQAARDLCALTPAAEQLFPQIVRVEASLGTLLGVLAERFPAKAVAETLAEVARRLAREFPGPAEGADVTARLQRAVEIIRELGGAAEVEAEQGRPFIRGYSCPLAGLAAGCPAVCALAESLLSESIGLRLRERCEKGENPRCRFDLAESAGIRSAL